MASQEKFFYATGRRKTSSARVYVKPGTGKFVVNGLDLQENFPLGTHQAIVNQPLVETNMKSKLDLKAFVAGGGKSGQAGALRHAVSRALTILDGDLRAVLKKAGFLTRDDRKVERKKYGQSGARKRYQYSKR